MDAANSGNVGRIIQLVSRTDTAGPEMQTVSMSAADLGLPAGGTVVLRIDEIGFLATAEADADGFVRFEVPKVETDKVVTIELSVLDSNGTVLWYGSDTQQVKDGGNLSISLTRQYWTLTPGSIAVSATSYSLLYDPATWESDATTLSVTGLEGAPAGSVFSYEWKDESGNVIGTDPTLTQSVYQLYGSPAGAGSIPPGDITKSITVTVSYTDASGAAVTADASAEIALGGPVVLPTFSLNAAPPSNPADYDAANSNLSAPLFALTSRSAGIVITTDVTDFPAGTQFTLTVNGTSFPSQASPSWTVSLADLGYTDATAPTSASPEILSIMCTAGNTRAQVPETGSGSASVCLLYTIPDFTVTVSPPMAPSYVAAKSDATNKKYALADLSGAFSFTPVPAAGTSFPAGTLFEWTVTMGSSSASRPDTTSSASCTASPSLIGLTAASIGRTSTAATAISVTCKAKNDHAADRNASNSGSTLASAFLLQTIPSFTISAEPASYDDDNSPKTGGTITAYALTSATGTIDISAGGATFPDGTTFDWTVNGTSLTGSTQHGSTLNLSPAALGITSANISKSSVSPTEIVIKCKAKNANAAADLDATDFTLKVFLLTIPDITVTLSTPPAGLTTDDNGAYLITADDLTAKNFGFTASPVAGSTMPDGVKYAWTIASTSFSTTPSATAQTITKTLDDLGVTAAPTTQQTLTVKCTVSHDSLAAGTEKYSTVDIKVIKKPPLGSKAAGTALAVGDIVFNDGSASPYTDFNTEAMTAEQAAAAVAVIFDDTNVKGVGLKQGTNLVWSTTSAVAFTTSPGPASNDFNGMANMNTIKNLSDWSDAATKYPAFYFADNYSTESGLTNLGSYANDWYLPARGELQTLDYNLSTVNAAINKIPNAEPLAINIMYWSSTQPTPDALGATGGSAYYRELGSGYSNPNLQYSPSAVCVIRAFP